MKKVINNPSDVVEETIEGFLAAYNHSFRKVENVNGITRRNLKDKVGVVIGGGSGHEPLFMGFAGDGLADGVTIGNVFAAPSPNNVQSVAQAVDSGKGVLFVYGNYMGDILNFDMAAELLEMEGIESRTVLVRDDVASAPMERYEDRRGIAGDVFVFKIAGGAAEQGLDLESVAKVTQKASDQTFSIGVALNPGTMPDSGESTFTLADDEIEFGMGIHGEPGVERTKMMTADELTERLMERLLDESKIDSGEEVSVLVNGLGSTTLMELFIVNRKVAQILEDKSITIHDMDVNSYCTTQEMGGLSITLLKLDSELKELYDAPANSPYYKK
ncbi:dihydroxyacetone kinase DhaK subunit [Halobacillus dabanensis]|uniref:Dihydroxyacetone kinase DhaK subunit n=1 Tax=Halobacillus dabanensis TaxID=240302 RepID=A0A1I3S267_HALDA|nr:dihydroxyacetone kinase subunit DhaK [Halobacillus dabanensis]SFJ52450.1 dihydroxyacetone kinase DhaK subunit [Halobacillus dabanensis]